MARPAVRLTSAAIASVALACGSTPSTPTSARPVTAPLQSAAQCDPSLWPHVHDTRRFTIRTACESVTGILVESHSSDDGDIDMDLNVDAQYKSLLNQGNLTKLHGNLHVEAICQAPVHPDVPDAIRSCAGFHGSVPIPPNGAYVRVTGMYVEDNDHGWMEIHPISALTVLR